MPNILTLPVQSGTLPAGQCPATLQAMADLFASIYTVPLPLSSGVTVIAQGSPPGQQFQNSNFAWLQLDDNLRPVRLYFYYTAWLSLHTLIPGHTMIWTSALPNFDTFDGGDSSGVISDTTGHMWEEVTELRAKFPIGAGTLPASPAGTGATLSVGDSGGEQLHVLTVAEGAMDPNHKHITGKNSGFSATYLIDADVNPLASDSFNAHENRGDGTDGASGQISTGSGPATKNWTGTTGVMPDSLTPNPITPHNNMPPYFTVYFLRRTARLFYAV